MKYSLLPISLLLFSCADRPLIYTGSQFAVHASGLKNEIPEKLSVGYDRTEYAWLPKGRSSSVQGSYDAEYRYNGGIAVSDQLITGPAAGGDSTEETYKNSDLIVSTNTKTNLGIEAVPSDGKGPSFNFGFKRSVLALFPKQTESNDLPSTYTDMTLHANGWAKNLVSPKGIATSRHIVGDAPGARIVQTIATGVAAENLSAGAEGVNLRKRMAAGLIPTE
jgi:hypothetical protein